MSCTFTAFGWSFNDGTFLYGAIESVDVLWCHGNYHIIIIIIIINAPLMSVTYDLLARICPVIEHVTDDWIGDYRIKCKLTFIV